MSSQILGGLVVGGVAIAVGVAWIFGAITTRRGRANFAPTYRRPGGAAYTVLEIGCSGVVILAGLGMIALVLLTRSR